MNSILLDVPLQIETDRLILRAPLQAGDGNVVHQAIKDSINELKQWLLLFQSIPTVEETEILLRNAHIDFLKRESFRYLIYHKDTNDFIGTASLHGINWKISKCEIGYWINTQFSGNGYMTEAVSELTNLGFQLLKFRRIEIRCESTNTKSRAIPEKLDFELEGILRNEDLSADGKELTDTCIYAKVH
ncbi:GNAT family N-acetyltransferase [Bacillus mycoides]|uniref:GNAT family N-acetyltransferase n=1 Tax=Bacillus mycoides TaxID=1405 RepID=UPI0001A04813|nr:GNAT family N-acetyltransferase [Bacillus mycoides]EEL05331.1 Acetyltransferase, GNAT [Bacillus cereus BDRD-ST196]KXY41416.1 acetyltransferase [Bacillus cereus]AIW84292.1 Acetyltransferase, GNAT [Bacillus mycoides]QEL85930.1 N-acetyltransferase [Bacillus mycoides]QWH01693.1 N-acetyltransferase [Bacillus mycoides]